MSQAPERDLEAGLYFVKGVVILGVVGLGGTDGRHYGVDAVFQVA